MPARSGETASIRNLPANVLKTELRILSDLGVVLTSNTRFLDFGCGAGNTVLALLSAGYQALGCDIRPRDGKGIGTDHNLFAMEDGRIPFPEASFDVVLSESVFEHVMDFQLAASECCRVLKPGGVGLHIMPSRYYLPLEPHLLVPFASFLAPDWWIWLWAHLGIRNSHQQGQCAQRVFLNNRKYVREGINYRNLTDGHLSEGFGRYCSRVEFREDLLLKNGHGRSRHLGPAVKPFPFIATFYRWFRMRIVVCWK